MFITVLFGLSVAHATDWDAVDRRAESTRRAAPWVATAGFAAPLVVDAIARPKTPVLRVGLPLLALGDVLAAPELAAAGSLRSARAIEARGGTVSRVKGHQAWASLGAGYGLMTGGATLLTFAAANCVFGCEDAGFGTNALFGSGVTLFLAGGGFYLYSFTLSHQQALENARAREAAGLPEPTRARRPAVSLAPTLEAPGLTVTVQGW